MLDSLMRPAAGATPVLNLGAMMGLPVTSNPAAAGASYSPGISGMKAANGPSDEAEQVQPKADPARSLMGAIAKGIVLQQQKARLQAQVCSYLLSEASTDSTFHLISQIEGVAPIL